MPIHDVAVNLIGRQFVRKNGKTYLVLTLAELMDVKDQVPHWLVKIHDDWCVEINERISE